MAFCGLCGKEIPEGQTFCRECNNKLANPKTEVGAVKKQKWSAVSVICFVAAGLTFLLCLLGGIQILLGADSIATLSSALGNTIAELFYNNCGTVFGGVGLFIIAFGLFSGALLAYLGCKYKKK